MTLKFEKDNTTTRRSWIVSYGKQPPFGRIVEGGSEIGFFPVEDCFIPVNWLAEIVAFIREQSGEAVPPAVDSALEKRVAELEKLVTPNEGLDKKTKDIERLCDMADEMADCIARWYTTAAGIVAESGFVTLNTDGDPVGRDPKIDRLIAKVRSILPRKSNG